jgi:hypothetical protein
MYSILDKDVPEKNLYCNIVRDMVETGDLGYGVGAGDLNLTTFIPTVESDCGVTIRSASEEMLAQSNAQMVSAFGSWIVVLMSMAMLAGFSISK